jgi:electron transport complex protein RnfC
VSGTVKAIEPRPHPLGDNLMAVVIENDGLDTPCNDLAPLNEKELQDPEAILARVKEAGVVGMGGAMFPTAFKIRSGLGKVDTLIINGAECEPYLNGDHLTMLNHPDELLKGIQLARIACGLDKAYYGIEKNKQDAIDLLNSKDPSQYGVEIVPEDVKYPQGGEKSQIKAITNREVKPGGLPSGVGCCVISTQTAYAIYRACYDGVPSYERIMTIAGSGVAAPVNAQVRIGMPFRYIIEQCGGFTKPPKKLVMGGPMMGLIISNIDAVNIKGTAGLLVFTEEENAEVETPTCIHCGHCLEVCPMRLEPVYMYKFFMKNDFEGMQKYHITDCIECGCCSYNCPGKLPLTHSFKTAKILIANRKAEEKARAEALAKEAEKK